MTFSQFHWHQASQPVRRRLQKTWHSVQAKMTPPRIRILLYGLLLLSVALTTWQAWPSFYTTTKLEPESHTDYLPYRIKQGDVLRQPIELEQDGLKEITMSFDMPGQEDIPADTRISLAIYAQPEAPTVSGSPAAGEADPGSETGEPVFVTSLNGDQIMGFARTAIPVNLGRRTAGKQFTLVMTVDQMPETSRLSVHTSFFARQTLLVDGHQTGLGLTMIFTYRQFNWPAFLSVIFLMLVLAFLVFAPLSLADRWFKAWPFLPLLLAPVITLMTAELLNSLNTRVWLDWPIMLLSYLVILLIELVIAGLTNRCRLAIYLNHGLFMVMAVVNHLKLFFRGDPFVAGDLASVTEAVHSINKLSFSVSNRLLMAFLVTLAYFRLFWPGQIQVRRRSSRWLLLSGGGVAIALLIGLVIRNSDLLRQTFDIQRYPWNQMMNYKENGLIIPWIQSTANLAVQKPEDDRKIPDDLYVLPADSQSGTVSADKPNIIAIMSESFCDFDNIRVLETSEPVMPFYDRLIQSKNTLHGNLLVSIFGGGTCNTEFEFLTGSSMLFLNDGSLPYNSYFNGRSHGLPDLFRQQGYRTVAIHPYLRTFWDRQLVYPNIGFDQFISLEDFPEGGLVRDFVGDEADFAQIIQTYETKSAAERLFIFSVTMQNHFPYYSSEEILAGLKYNIKLPGLTDVESVELYLSMLRQSDDALRDLVTYFANIEEPTIIVLFGDHLPGNHNAFNNFYQMMFNKTIAELSLAETQKLYETPWLIWANYDLPETGQADTVSPNFLSAKVLDFAGAAASPYFKYVKSLNQTIQAMNNKMILLRNGITFDREHIPASVVRKLDRYWAYEYDNIIRDKSQ